MKIFLNICSTIFAIIGPLLFFIAPFFSFCLVDSPKPMPLCLTITACVFLTPISMIFCGCKMWAYYKSKQYKKSLIFCCIPFILLLFLFNA